MAKKASAVEGTDPSLLITESVVVNDGVAGTSPSRSSTVSMGDPEEYSAQAGVLTFRGGPLRQNAAYGTVDVQKQQLTVVRGIRNTVLGNEQFTGYSFGSQPVIVKWYKNIREMMNIHEDMRDTTAMKEVIVASADGRINFFDLDKQAFSRDAIVTSMPLDAAPAVNPYGYPLLYVGQKKDTVSGESGVMGMRIYNLIDQSLIDFESGYNPSAFGSDGAIISSPVIESDSDTVIYGGENGMLYTVSMNTDFDLDNAQISVNPQVSGYAYKTDTKFNKEYGITGSVATYGDYAYFGDMAGVIQCVDMNTLQCVWAYDIGDSVVASVSLEVEDDDVYLYAGNVVNKRERSSQVNLVKLNALTGEKIWECPAEIKGKYASKPAAEGIYAGLMASPLVGQGDISDLVIFNVNRVVGEKDQNYAIVYALDKTTGEEVWSQPIDVESISSPIALYQPDGKSYIVMGDENGTLRLMDGFTGLTISHVNLGSAIQASPAAYNNQIVVGTTGGMLYFVNVE